MSQKYTPVQWTDETPETPGTIINKARLDQMQSAHHFADGFEEVDAVPTADPGVDYHKVVFCTADTTFYRWDGTQWTKDVDDSTLALLEAHEADHANPHQVTKSQLGLGNVDNTSDANKPVSTAQQTALDGKADRDLKNLNGIGGTKADGKTLVWDSANNQWKYGEAGKVDDVRIEGQSIVESKIADLPFADNEQVGVVMTGFDGYIESPYWEYTSSVDDYIGLWVSYEYWYELVTIENKNDLGIVPGTTPSYFHYDNTYPVHHDRPRFVEFYGYPDFDVTEAYRGFFVRYNGRMVKVDEENKDSLGIVPGTTPAYNHIGGLYTQIEVDQYVGSNTENPVSSKAVLNYLLGFVDLGTQQTITGLKTFLTDVNIGAQGYIPFTLSVLGQIALDGDLNVSGDIIQQGSSYETHAEQIYTTKDYIYMREGAVGGLLPGQSSGLEIVKYNGTQNARIICDSGGTLRCGNVNDERPLLVRDEVSNMVDGGLIVWALSGYRAEPAGTVGTDDQPIKLQNGVPVPVTNPLERKITELNKAKITYTNAVITTASNWNVQTGTVTIPNGSPYFSVDNGKIRIEEAGMYLLEARLVNNVSLYEGITNSVTIQQNGVHNTQIVSVQYCEVGQQIAATIYGSTTGTGAFETYNGLNTLQVTKL